MAVVGLIPLGGTVTVKACLSLADLVAYTSGGGRCRCFLAPQTRRRQSSKEFNALGVNKTEREDKSVEVVEESGKEDNSEWTTLEDLTTEVVTEKMVVAPLLC
ncbi:hypothetical protein V8G54_028233 [Vigna mungo]|uniref:Uncharacterized protein n=1 Tax=Vigna mungo TaxID=3915 RepID=A0AAQ3MRU3_VIGMU